MIKFIVDSTFGVSKEYAANEDIKIVSLKTILDGKVTDEGFENEWGEFFARFKTSETFPSTSQPNAEAYADKINEIYASDADAEIIILTIASRLSGTVNSARIAKESFAGKKIEVIDSQNATVACFLVLNELVEYAKSGKTFEETVQYSQTVIQKASVKFVPSTMKYLRRGGRIGTLGALFAGIMSVKPIFEFKNNVIAIPAKVLGFSKAISEMIKMLPKKIKKLHVCYIGDNENVPLILEKVQQMLELKSVEVKAVSPVFGIHVGIGAVGIACIEE